jgi:uncharacterized phage-associated protein
VLGRRHQRNDAVIIMANEPISPHVAEELRKLALLSDDEINTADIPEIPDWSSGARGRFAKRTVIHAGYDVRAIANWVLDYLSQKAISASNMSLNKLVYFLVERGLIERGILYTPARMEAWDHGPVFREIYHSIKDYGDKPIKDRIMRFSIKEKRMIVASEKFSSEDELFFKSVIDDYGSLSAARLRNISHSINGPWYRVWYSKINTNPGMSISTNLILLSASNRRIK